MEKLSAIIAETRNHVSQLTYYKPGAEQPPHEHQDSQISILLLGSLHEEAEGRHHEIAVPFLCFKPEGTVHRNVFGNHGALLLSMRFHPGSEHRDAILRKGWGWWRLRTPQTASKMPKEAFREAFERPPEREQDDAPDWLCAAKTSLEQEARGSSITELAKLLGVHRVHLTRCFTKHYGVSPSAFRRRHMATLALERMIHAHAPAATAAVEAGFADQSHMIRAMRQLTGLTPRRLIRALA